METIELSSAGLGIVTVAVLLYANPGRVGADDWPQWQGPDQTDKPAWSHPVIASELCVREQGVLFCHDVKRGVR